MYINVVQVKISVDCEVFDSLCFACCLFSTLALLTGIQPVKDTVPAVTKCYSLGEL